jgi:protein-tyrosine phosphatase
VLDASNIARRLWVGSVPPFDRVLPEFDLLVLCAREIQPPEIAFRGTVLRCPIPDAVLAPRELSRTLVTGRSVATALLGGRRVLVTCAAGRNRSALVAGLALGLATTMPPPDIVALIRQRRSTDCLSNPFFVDVLNRYLPTAADR